MKSNWTNLKQIIGTAERNSDLFISLIDEDGQIESANNIMMKSLELKDPRTNRVNFFDLVHPIHKNEFRNTLGRADNSNPSSAELYIKNGQYHPMKWEVNEVIDGPGSRKKYLCLGYKIMGEEKWIRFNKLVKQHHQLILEGFGAIIFHDQQGEVIAANQKMTNLFQTSLERVYQLKNIRTLWEQQWDITDENDVKISFDEAPFILAAETGLPQKKMLVIRVGNGEKRWMLFNCQVLPEEESAGQIVVVSTIIDMTHERQLSRQLMERDALLHTFLQRTPTMSWVVDEDAKLLFASHAFCDAFKLDSASCFGKKVTDLVSEHVTEALYKDHLEVLETGDVIDTTRQMKLADGTHVIYHVNLFPIFNQGGKTLIGGQAVCIPDKTPLEKELRLSHERLLHFSKATSDAIWEWDMQSGQIFRNEALMELIGYQPDNSRGLSWWLRRIHPEDRNRVADKVKEATDALKQSWQDEYRFKCADGQYRDIQDKGFVVYENGLPVRMIGSLQNVSHLKQLQSKLADERLERQKEISETIIRVQEKERARIGHELHDNINQILSTANLFVDMLKAGNKEQQQVKDKSIEYLKLAVMEIRKLSKDLVAPQLREEKLTDSIQFLVDDIAMAGAMRISFTHSIEANQLSAGKKITLFRIVQEQLKNILTHSHAKSIQIQLEQAEENVKLTVRDNGKGFDPAKTHQGIGLSNIHERTQFYNGSVVIDAAPGKGCCIVVMIPALD